MLLYNTFYTYFLVFFVELQIYFLIKNFLFCKSSNRKVLKIKKMEKNNKDLFGSCFQ